MPLHVLLLLLELLRLIKFMHIFELQVWVLQVFVNFIANGADGDSLISPQQISSFLGFILPLHLCTPHVIIPKILFCYFLVFKEVHKILNLLCLSELKDLIGVQIFEFDSQVVSLLPVLNDCSSHYVILEFCFKRGVATLKLDLKIM